jgi:hypothetical protein
MGYQTRYRCFEMCIFVSCLLKQGFLFGLQSNDLLKFLENGRDSNLPSLKKNKIQVYEATRVKRCSLSLLSHSSSLLFIEVC